MRMVPGGSAKGNGLEGAWEGLLASVPPSVMLVAGRKVDKAPEAPKLCDDVQGRPEVPGRDTGSGGGGT